VNTNVRFEKISEEGKKRFDELCHRLEGWDEEQKHSYPLHGIFGVEVTKDEEGNETGPGYYSWNIEHMGAKWAYMEDADEDGFRIESAWDTPVDAINFIAEQIAEVDPDSVLRVTSEDEFPNWISAYYYTGGAVEDYQVWDWDEIRDELNTIDELREHYNEEEEDWDEAGHDMIYDYLWDTCYELQEKFFLEMTTEEE
jgi:hypothetical protein